MIFNVPRESGLELSGERARPRRRLRARPRESVIRLASAPLPSGQSGSCLGGNPTQVFNFVQFPGAPAGDFDLYVKPSLFPSCFANDLPAKRAAVLAASQRPITLSAAPEKSGTPTWKTIPSW